MSSTASCSNSSATGRSPCLSAFPIAPSYSSELPIAFSKIEGFEVTPLTPSLSISFCRSPLRTKPRARKSSQIDWPWFSSALTGFMMPCSISRFPHFLAGGEILSTGPGRPGGQYAHAPGITPLTTYRSRPNPPFRGGFDVILRKRGSRRLTVVRRLKWPVRMHAKCKSGPQQQQPNRAGEWQGPASGPVDQITKHQGGEDAGQTEAEI